MVTKPVLAVCFKQSWASNLRHDGGEHGDVWLCRGSQNLGVGSADPAAVGTCLAAVQKDLAYLGIFEKAKAFPSASEAVVDEVDEVVMVAWVVMAVKAAKEVMVAWAMAAWGRVAWATEVWGMVV